MDPDLSRRTFIANMAAGALGAASAARATCPPDPLAVCNVTHLYSIRTAGIVEVRDADDIRNALRRWHGRVAIGGGRYSMGGQTALDGALQLDMRSMRNLVSLDAARKVVRVEAGMRWRDLQTLIDPHGLAVRTMQSYSNFTVGGSVSVNCHGRYVGHGGMVGSIRALQLVMANGEVIEASPQRESELFRAAIGGYGAVGVITQAEVDLDDNVAIERSTERVRLADYVEWFRESVALDPTAMMHNADLMPAAFDLPHAVTWRRTAKPLTEAARLRPTGAGYAKERAAIFAMTELPGGAGLRRSVQLLDDRPAVVWRNHEASRDVAELEPASRALSTYVLQEYFIPERHFAAFATAMSTLIQRSGAAVLNVSIRHAPEDPLSLMAWAREDVFSFVVYYKQRVTPAAQRAAGEWTRAMIGLALEYGGSYYLPYQLHATQAQFEASYPQAGALRKLRASIGAQRFSHALWDRYGV